MKARILKSGETDINSSDIWRFVLHEGYPTQKVYTQGSFSLFLPSGSEFPASHTIYHNLGYMPVCRVSAIGVDGYLRRVTGGTLFDDPSMDDYALGYMSYGVSNSDLAVSVGYSYPIPTTANRTFTFYYIILMDD